MINASRAGDGAAPALARAEHEQRLQIKKLKSNPALTGNGRVYLDFRFLWEGLGSCFKLFESNGVPPRLKFKELEVRNYRGAQVYPFCHQNLKPASGLIYVSKKGRLTLLEQV